MGFSFKNAYVLQSLKYILWSTNARFQEPLPLITKILKPLSAEIILNADTLRMMQSNSGSNWPTGFRVKVY